MRWETVKECASKFHCYVQIFWYGDDTRIDWVASSGWQSRWRAVIRLLVVGLRGPASSLSPELACPWQKWLEISINANSPFNFMFSLILPRLRASRSEYRIRLFWKYWVTSELKDENTKAYRLRRLVDWLFSCQRRLWRRKSIVEG